MNSFGRDVFHVESEDTSFCGTLVSQTPPLPGTNWPSLLITCLVLEVFEFLTPTVAHALFSECGNESYSHNITVALVHVMCDTHTHTLNIKM